MAARTQSATAAWRAASSICCTSPAAATSRLPGLSAAPKAASASAAAAEASGRPSSIAGAAPAAGTAGPGGSVLEPKRASASTVDGTTGTSRDWGAEALGLAACGPSKVGGAQAAAACEAAGGGAAAPPSPPSGLLVILRAAPNASVVDCSFCTRKQGSRGGDKTASGIGHLVTRLFGPELRGSPLPPRTGLYLP